MALAGVAAGAAAASIRRDSLDRRLGGPELPRRPLPEVGGAVWLTALAAVTGVVVSGLAGAAAAVGSVVVVRWLLARRRAARDERLREEQLADAAAALAAGLRAGLSLAQAIAYARDESLPPLRHDLARLVSAIELGTPVGDALAHWADATGAEDARLVAAVVDLHRRSGGDLPSVLDGVVATLRERRAASREVRALTAQARLSGAILGTLPVGFFVFLMLTARGEMLAAISTPLGRTAVAVGLMLELVAFAWIRKLLAVR